ncbi:MAG: ABC transporter ATP-binding protein [Flavobacteriales bacterium]
MIEGRNLQKSYEQNKVLNDFSFSISENSIYGLLGKNGAGKTTLIRIINQIIAPDKGQILFKNEPLTKKHIPFIGYLPEERGLYKKMKVGEQSLYLAQLKGLSKNKAKEQLKYWFDKFEMLSWWDKTIEELSKGMAQKVQFVSSIIHQPKLLILDEPFSGFDPVNANQIINEIKNLKSKGTTIIFSTHRMESIEQLCDEICMIDKGKKVLEGTTNNIKHKFHENIYEIVFEGNLILDKNYEVISSETNNVLVKLKKEQSSNELIKHISNQVEIQNFRLKLPTLNDIFIKKSKEDE